VNAHVPIANTASAEHERLRSAFKQRSADLAVWLDKQPNITITGEPPGTSSDVYGQQNVVLAGYYDGSSAIIKVYSHTARDCALAEADALARFSRFGLPVPDIRAHYDTQLPDGSACSVLILEQLPGAPLHTVLPEADGNTATRAGAAVAHLLAKEYGSERFPLPGDELLLAASWDRIERRYASTLAHGLGVEPAVLRQMRKRAQSFSNPQDMGWVTFDWRLRHLLWDGSLAGVLDFEYTKPFDSTIELANLLHDLVVSLEPEVRNPFAVALLATYKDLVVPSGCLDEPRLLFCMARQALSHAAVKHWQGVRDDRPTVEANLAQSYLGAQTLADALRLPSIVQSRHVDAR
jgi:hypothetical protein